MTDLKLKRLISLCKCSVSVEIDKHKNYYESVSAHLDDLEIDEEDVDRETMNRMIEMDTIVIIQFYPDTPVGFYRVYDYDLDRALSKALAVLE